MKYLLIAGLLTLIVLQTGCYYNKEELLNPGNICDTTNITYRFSVNPILTINCTGCHSGPNAPNGVRLETYEGVKIQASNGFLLSVITHSAGYPPMPKNGGKLSDCNIEKIRKWIDAGAPDN
jgi:hypothetical protein